MNQYVTGAIIRKLREERKMTQQQLADILAVTDKSISKWETGRGYPDISLLEPLASALGISVIELMNGEEIRNENRTFKMSRIKFYVCPLCGNIIFSTGEAVISCCGITLPPIEAEEGDEDHMISVENVEDEYYVTANHPMKKDHYISFMAAVKNDSCEIIKLYPEGNAEARFKTSRTRTLYYYCNRDGLYKLDIKRKK